jgi:hypothetical protein
MLWLINYESSEWCGGESHVVVVAETADEANYLAEDHMETTMRELFSDEYTILEAEYAEEGVDAVFDCAYTINSIEAFDENHEDWKYYINPSQEQFYPTIGKF